ncbi:MAG: hypothetical protein K5668_10195 [Lachnospiraceae bacterium]|nr:hypothetical protein [Lachnospiraceae bacterium]
MRKRYKAYDSLAKSWYELTHEKSLEYKDLLKDDADENLKNDAILDRAIPAEHSKNIIEYTGIYDKSALMRTLALSLSEPGNAIDRENITLKPYKDSPNNGVGPDRLIKSHKKILLLGEADENTGIKTRYKFDEKFLGIEAKHQFTSADTEETALTTNADRTAGYAEKLGLESDRKDINGNFLFSEENAEILHAKISKTGKKVHGFYINGEFLTDDTEGVDVKGKPGEKRVAGKKDMAFFGRRDFTKQEKAEKLRVAIRTSPFFQHVNARTIQYYSGYDVAEDYGDDIEESFEKIWKKAAKKNAGLTKENALQSIRRDPKNLSKLPGAVRGPALAAYLIEEASRDRAEGEEAFSYTNTRADKVLRYAIDSERSSLQLTCLALLANDEDPGLWRLAKNILVQNPKIVKKRTRIKLKYLPEDGNMMRMGLLDELASHQGVFSESDIEEDPFAFMDMASRQVYMEELENRRGGFNSFKKNLLNGKILSKSLSIASTGIKAAQHGSDAANLFKDSDFEVDDETKERREETEFWLSYGETIAESNNIASIISAAGVGVSWLAGGSPSAARDYSFQFFDVMEIIGQVTSIIKDIVKFCKFIYRKFKKDPKTLDEIRAEEKKKRETLEDLDCGGIKAVLAFAGKVVSLLNTTRDLASYHVSSEDSSFDVIQNETWGNLLAYKGPLDYALTTANNIIAILSDVVDIYTSTKRIWRINDANKDIETAISEVSVPDNIPGVVDREGQKRRQLGQAALDNSQAQYFMSLTKMQSRKTRSQASWDIASKFLTITKDTVNIFVPTADPYTAIAKAVLTVAPMVVDFISWTIGKLKYDRQNFNNNIASMLGDASYAKTPYFDKVLKRETGIVSSSYLVDIARIFMSIDTHVLAHKEEKSPGELELAKTVVGTMYGNVNEDSVKTVKLDAMMKYAGFSGDSDWRAVLRNSIRK